MKADINKIKKVCGVGFALIAACLCIKASTVFAESDYLLLSRPDETIVNRITDTGLTTGELKDKPFDELSDDYFVMSDEEHDYYVNKENQDIVMIMLNDDKDEELVEMLETKKDVNAIDRSTADGLLDKVLTGVFPEYDLEAINVSCDNNIDNYLEYFNYYIEEVSDGARVNLATISFTIDGQLSLLIGTHNSKDIFENSNDMPLDQALDIITNYIIKNKNEIENNYFGFNDDEGVDDINDEPYEATADMVLPDGTNPGEMIYPEVIESFNLFFSGEEDLHDIKGVKIIYDKKPAWEIKFRIKSDLGEKDPLFNPQGNAIVDIETGEVLDFSLTDGE